VELPGRRAARLTLRLLQEGYKVATAAHRRAPVVLSAGLVHRAGRTDDPSLHRRVAQLARSSASRLAVNTAFTDRGDTGVA
jgi:hypothetical protein